MTTNTRLLSARAVRVRYGDKSAKTIDRWQEAGILPPPIRINNQRYWYEHDLETMERASMVPGASQARSGDGSFAPASGEAV